MPQRMRPAHIALAVAVTAVWGVNFVVIEVGLDHFPPLLFSALRFGLSAVPAIFFVKRPKVAWKWVIAFGLTLGAVKYGLLHTGMRWGMPAGLSSLVLQIQAVFTTVFAAMFLRERPGGRRIAGLAIALGGIVVAAVAHGGGGPVGAFVLIIAAAAAWGVANVITRKASPPHLLSWMVWISAVPVLPLLALSLIFEGPRADLDALAAIDLSGFGAIAYAAGVSTLFGFGAWGYLMSRYDASSVAPYSLLVPFFGMSSAWVFLGEAVTVPSVIAAVLVVGGIAVSASGRAAAKKAAQPALAASR
ncbi:membrane protein [Actinorhabdospora filicis]|uniref:Membrane protein n=1 Tax=Actinorhabdospora filicis TaxID=1785913 RepID=A0A9W6SKD5_9ACTN|nr:EamA family transporter [Actinorhabdospora filicis]GLZ77259.1 membrane protein [Actinorhabdospora filicis]